MKKWLLIGAVALWVWLLRGFVETKLLVVLSLAGPLLLFAGIGILRALGPSLLQTVWTAGTFIAGLAMTAGAMATLAPAAPADWLATSAWGWDLLDQRTARLAAAVDAGDAALTRRLARRGLGDVEPLDRSGRPIVQRATDATVLTALLDAGLDPDARDEEERTFLMIARDPEIVRALLAAGADVDARDRQYSTVADVLPEALRTIVETHAGRTLARRDDLDQSGGRRDWLTTTGDASALLERSAASVDPARVDLGATATVSATMVNPSNEDRLLDLSATLGAATLFVAASHDGAIESPRRPQILQTIRWPLLSLPARSQGRVTLQVITRSDPDARDLDVAWHSRVLPAVDVETLHVSQPLVRGTSADAPGAWTWGIPAAAVALAVLLWLTARRRQARAGSSSTGVNVPYVASIIASAVAVLCGVVVAVFLWSIAEPYLQFDPAECTVLDHRIRTYTYQTSTSIDESRRAVSSQSETRTGFAPAAAVRIESDPPVIAAGFDVGFVGGSVQDLRKYPLGSRVACWVDPSFPGRFTLVRRPSLGAWTGLFALTMLGLVFMAIGRGLRSGGDAPNGRAEAQGGRKPRRQP